MTKSKKHSNSAQKRVDSHPTTEDKKESKSNEAQLEMNIGDKKLEKYKEKLEEVEKNLTPAERKLRRQQQKAEEEEKFRSSASKESGKSDKKATNKREKQVRPERIESVVVKPESATSRHVAQTPNFQSNPIASSDDHWENNYDKDNTSHDNDIADDNYEDYNQTNTGFIDQTQKLDINFTDDQKQGFGEHSSTGHSSRTFNRNKNLGPYSSNSDHRNQRDYQNAGRGFQNRNRQYERNRDSRNRDGGDWYEGNQNTRSRNDTNDDEYYVFKEQLGQHEINFRKVQEKFGDLFDAPSEYALAHCVAEDMSMGAGVAINFRKEFKRVGDLLNQHIKTGGLAYLQEKNRFIYYLVTKERSNGKPTLQTLWSSLNCLKNHMVSNGVQKLALPQIGCGLDRLQWSEVKQMLEYVFKDEDIEIVVYKLNDEERRRIMRKYNAFKWEGYKTVRKEESNTSRREERKKQSNIQSREDTRSKRESRKRKNSFEEPKKPAKRRYCNIFFRLMIMLILNLYIVILIVALHNTYEVDFSFIKGTESPEFIHVEQYSPTIWNQTPLLNEYCYPPFVEN